MNWKSILSTVAGLVLVLALIFGLVFLILGPSGLSRNANAWLASAYGSDWLVVHYAQDGKVINHWELEDKSIGNETQSDGIFFLDNSGNVVHLSGHYVYIEIKNDAWQSARDKFLKK